jgi:hypothetical protein
VHRPQRPRQCASNRRFSDTRQPTQNDEHAQQCIAVVESSSDPRRSASR